MGPKMPEERLHKSAEDRVVASHRRSKHCGMKQTNLGLNLRTTRTRKRECINETLAARIARKLGQFDEVTCMLVLDASCPDVA